jgi:hypothetical protein
MVMAVFREGHLAARISLVSIEVDDLPFGLEWAHGPLLLEDERRFPHLDAVVEAIERRCGERRNEPRSVDAERRQHTRRVSNRTQLPNTHHAPDGDVDAG